MCLYNNNNNNNNKVKDDNLPTFSQNNKLKVC